METKDIVIPIDPREREFFWKRLVEKQIDSGQEVEKFCAEHKLGRARFYYWRQKIRCYEDLNG